MIGSVPGLYPPDVRSSHTVVTIFKISPDIAKNPLSGEGGKIIYFKSTLLNCKDLGSLRGLGSCSDKCVLY